MSYEENAQVLSCSGFGRGTVNQRRGAAAVQNTCETPTASANNHFAMQIALANSLGEEAIKIGKKESLDEAKKERRKKGTIADMIQMELLNTKQDGEEGHVHVSCPHNQATMTTKMLRFIENNIQHIMSATDKSSCIRFTLGNTAKLELNMLASAVRTMQLG